METRDKISSKIKGKGNTIFTIHPYKLEDGGWYFDDDSRDVYKEAFVAGADDLLDLVCKGAIKCTALFSAEKFPDHDLTLALLGGHETGSGDYHCVELKHDLWLCSCILRYYPQGAPKTIYVKIKV